MKIVLNFEIMKAMGLEFVNFNFYDETEDNVISYCLGRDIIGVTGTCFSNHVMSNKTFVVGDIRKVGRVIYNYNLLMNKSIQ